MYSRTETRMLRSELLAFDPYSPVQPVPAPERNDTDPLVLDPLSPTTPALPGKPSKWAVKESNLQPWD